MIHVVKGENDWNKALSLADRADVYHTYHYHQLSKNSGDEAILIKYEHRGAIVLLPLLIRTIEGTIYKDATSVYGYAGVLPVNDNEHFNCAHFSKELNTFFKQENIISVFSRLHPYIKHQETILSQLGGVSSPGNVVYIDLSQPLDEQRQNYSRRLKTHLNKARKHCYVQQGYNDDHLEEFMALYYENMRKVNAKSFYFFSKAYFKALLQNNQFTTDLLICRLKDNDKAIAAGLFTKCNGIVQYHLSGTDDNYDHLNAVKLLIDYTRITSTKAGYTYFNLGGGRSSKDDSLFYFKSRFSKSFEPFNIWKYIVNKEAYLVLEEQFNYTGVEEVKQEDTNYFPSYRRYLTT